MTTSPSSPPFSRRPGRRGGAIGGLALVLLTSIALPSCQESEKPGAKSEAPGPEQNEETPAPKKEAPAPKEGANPSEKTVKALLAEAASMDADLWKEVLSAGTLDQDALRAESGETLTAHVLLKTSSKGDSSTPSSITIPATVDPAELAAAVAPRSVIRKHVSVIQPKYITDLEMELDGPTLKGTVSFEASNQAYRGTLGFEGSPALDHPSGWRITAFHFVPEKYRLVLGEDGKWTRLKL